MDGHISLLEKDYKEFKLQINKQFIEEILIQRVLKTTIQILFDTIFLIIMLILLKYWKIFCLLQGLEQI